MKALRYLIANSKDIESDMVKKTLIWIINHTKRLTRPVSLGITSVQLAEDVIIAIAKVNSYKGNTHLPQIMSLAQIPVGFSVRRGRYIAIDKFKKSGGCTIWLSREIHDHSAKRLKFDKKKIKNIVLSSNLWIL